MKNNEFSNLIKNCYHLPWSKDDNPNGWIEPTTYCQLKCPGCYRGLDKDGAVHIHENLEELKRQVDVFLKTRNVQTISIAGGEPLLYPKTGELISYIKSLGLKTKIFTNGIILNEALLEKLKECGASEFLIHIDKFQPREGYKNKTENELNDLRNYYCGIFRRVGGVNLGFIQPFSKDNLSDINSILKFCKNNVDIVSLVVFTLYSDINWSDSIKFKINADITVLDVVSAIKNQFSYVPSAYLGSTIDPDSPTWLFSISVGFKDSELGFFDGKLYRNIELRHYKKTGRYLITKIGNKISLLQLFKLINYSCVRKILKNYLVSILKNPSRIREYVYLQRHLVLRGPKLTNNKRDLCDGCPDAMFYDGRLVPSCILEEIKLSKRFD
ncbi:MAG: radical SAM protein [Patescibacteria group bacterium]